MVRKFLYVLPALFVVAIIAYWHSITTFMVHRCLDSYCSNQLGTPLNISKVYRNVDHWVVDQPSIIKEGLVFQADRFLINASFNPFKLELDFGVVIDKPMLHFDENDPGVKDLFAGCFPQSHGFDFWPIKVKTNLAVNDGVVFYGKEEKKQFFASFHTNAYWSSTQQEAKIAFNFDADHAEKNRFQVMLKRDVHDSHQTEVMFNHVDGEKIGTFLEGLGLPLKGWCITDGIVHGVINMEGSAHQEPMAWGQLDLQDLRFENPTLNMHGVVKKSQLQLDSIGKKRNLASLNGKIEILEDASIVINREGRPFWEIKNLIGGVTFRGDKGIGLAFRAKCQQEMQHFDVAMTGDASLAAESPPFVDVVFNIQHPDKQDATLHFYGRPLEGGLRRVEVAFQNMGKQEFMFIQIAALKYFPDWNTIQMHSGNINASGTVFLHGLKPADIKIDNIFAKDVKFDLGPGELSISSDETSGSFAIDLAASNILQTLDADFLIKQAQAQFCALDGKLWKFKDFGTDIAVRHGVIQQSEMQGEFAGLKGTILLDWLSPHEAARLSFRGHANELFDMAPQSLKSGLEKSFNDDLVVLSAGMKWDAKGAKIEGEIRIIPPSTLDEKSVSFGFSLEKSSEKLWKQWPASTAARSFWENVGLEAMQSVLPPIAAPTVLLESNWLKAETGIAGLVMRQGWFSAQNVPLDKFLQPFLFPRNRMQINGTGNFKGLFDHSKLAVEYTGENVVLESNDLVITAPKIESRASGVNRAKFYAAHHFDFAKGIHFGSLPLENCTYFEKSSGLFFSEINGSAMFEGQKIHFNEIETKCNGVYLAGSIELDLSIPHEGCYNVGIKNTELKGKVSQVQDLLQHFKKAKDVALLKIPLEGDVVYRGNGGWINLSFRPNEYQFEGIFEGSIVHGELPISKGDVSLKDLKMDFIYNHAKSFLEFSNIQGVLGLKSPQMGEEFLFAGQHIRFDNFRQEIAHFDVWLGDHTRDIVRLAGRTGPILARDESSHLIKFYIDSDLTHFGDIHPSELELVLNDWTQIETFHIGLNLRLNTLLNDLHRFARSGVLSLSRNLANDFDNVKNSSGELNLDVNYLKHSGEFAFQIDGEHIALGESSFDRFFVFGTKRGNAWHVDELQFDDTVVSASFEKKGKIWGVNQLNIQHRNSLTMELDGDFDPKENVLKAHVKNLEMDLEALQEWPDLEKFVEDCRPSGQMIASGDIVFALTKEAPGWNLSALLNGCLTSWEFKGLRLGQTRRFSCHFVSNKGLTLRNLQTSLLAWDSETSKADLEIEKTYYGFANGELHIEGLTFDLQAQNLPWIADNLQREFPDLITPNVAEVMSAAKSIGRVKGSLNFELSPPYTALRLALADGQYRFLESEHELQNFVLELDPFEFNASAQYKWGSYPFWVHARSTSPTLENGDLVLTDVGPGQANPHEALYISWEKSQEGLLSIKEIQGILGGLTVHLQEDVAEESAQPGFVVLDGQVDIDLTKAQAFFSPEVSSRIVYWGLSDGYYLTGKWKFPNNAHNGISENLYFSGELHGQNIDMKGFEFDSLSASVEYMPKGLAITDFTIDDMACAVTIPQFNMSKRQDNRWYFSMSSLHITRLRPSYLREPGMPRPHTYKPLVFTDITLEGCHGCADDFMTLSGKGTLHFSNRSKKLLQNTIFHIPGEILSRIGLDLSVLTPVTGSINYSIANGRFYFTKFKDIYSEGKLSKFYLPSGTSKSYMDFDGNLNVQVKMKQYNLLFKLAELFTVTVQGSIQKPTYTLQKQHKSEQYTSR